MQLPLEFAYDRAAASGVVVPRPYKLALFDADQHAGAVDVADFRWVIFETRRPQP
jgi:hypothetical protein